MSKLFNKDKGIFVDRSDSSGGGSLSEGDSISNSNPESIVFTNNLGELTTSPLTVLSIDIGGEPVMTLYTQDSTPILGIDGTNDDYYIGKILVPTNPSVWCKSDGTISIQGLNIIALGDYFGGVGNGTYLIVDDSTNRIEGVCNGDLYLSGVNTSLIGSNSLKISTFNIQNANSKVGDVLTVKDSNTGECDFLPQGGVNVVSASNNIPLANTGYYTFTGTISTSTLPVASNSIGVRYVLLSMASGVWTINTTGGVNEIYVAGLPVNTFAVQAGESYIMYSNGLVWFILT